MTVRGGITVEAGGWLAVVSGEVRGSITATDGPNTVLVDFSFVRGDVTVAGLSGDCRDSDSDRWSGLGSVIRRGGLSPVAYGANGIWTNMVTGASLGSDGTVIPRR